MSGAEHIIKGYFVEFPLAKCKKCGRTMRPNGILLGYPVYVCDNRECVDNWAKGIKLGFTQWIDEQE